MEERKDEERCENLDKFENFQEMVNCRYSTGCKPRTSLDLG